MVGLDIHVFIWYLLENDKDTRILHLEKKMFVDVLTTDALVFLGITEYLEQIFKTAFLFCFSLTNATLDLLMVICNFSSVVQQYFTIKLNPSFFNICSGFIGPYSIVRKLEKLAYDANVTQNLNQS